MKNRLRELRKDRSQFDMAKEFHVSQQTWSSWEVGRTTPNYFKMQEIEDYFGVKKEEIFFEAFNYKTELKKERD